MADYKFKYLGSEKLVNGATRLTWEGTSGKFTIKEFMCVEPVGGVEPDLSPGMIEVYFNREQGLNSTRRKIELALDAQNSAR